MSVTHELSAYCRPPSSLLAPEERCSWQGCLAKPWLSEEEAAELLGMSGRNFRRALERQSGCAHAPGSAPLGAPICRRRFRAIHNPARAFDVGQKTDIFTRYRRNGATVKWVLSASIRSSAPRRRRSPSVLVPGRSRGTWGCSPSVA